MQPSVSHTPRELGYHMPAEWHTHTATWLSWPRREGISFPERYDEVMPTFAEIVRALHQHEAVHINICDAAMGEFARNVLREHQVPLHNVFFHNIPTNEPWCRDHGPIFIVRTDELAVVNWRYNAWGGKYQPYDLDDAVPRQIAQLLNVPCFDVDMVLEGGAIDVNGEGLLLTSESCLLNPNRNPDMSKQQIEQKLKDYLGVNSVLWLDRGIVGDDTDGHVDDIARFVSRDTAVIASEQDTQDANYDILRENIARLHYLAAQAQHPLHVIELPMPGVVEYKGQRLPASYANFYIANKAVLLPTYRNPKTDASAQAILQRLFPHHRVTPIDSTNLVWGLGSFHCLTQQQPAPRPAPLPGHRDLVRRPRGWKKR
jgi:agmatine deiminase